MCKTIKQRVKFKADPATVYDLLADSPTLTDPRLVDLEVQRGEVLAEETVRELAAQPAFPIVEVFALEGVDRLIIAAVMLAVANEVPDQPAAQACGLRPRRPYLDRL